MNPKNLHIPNLPALPAAGRRSERLIAFADQLSTMVTKRRYEGDNSCIATVYAPLRASILLMLAITLITLIFGTLVPIESAAIAQGNVTVLSKRKTVQHLEGGIIKNILVKDGDLVKVGQPLIELSDIAPKANQTIVQSDLWSARAAEARLNSLKDGSQSLVFSEEVLHAAQNNPDLAKTLVAQQELFASQRDAQIGKLKTLQQRIAESREEITGLRAQIESAQGQLAYINEEIGTVKTLLADGLATRPRLLALQRQAEELKGSRGQNIAMIAKVQQTITETDMQIINQQNEFATQIAEEMKDVSATISDHKEKLSAVADVMDRTIVTAPSEGIVTGLKFHTVGGVIDAGAPILDIVPQNEQLVLEVKIQPTDIDVVKPGLESRVVFPAYKARRMPLLSGVVTQVSADAFTEQQGLTSQSYYTARVQVDAKQLKEMESPVTLYPGMPADVYITTGSRSFIAYLFAPVTESMGKAFKEE